MSGWLYLLFCVVAVLGIAIALDTVIAWVIRKWRLRVLEWRQ